MLFCILTVTLVGGANGQGNVYARNPETGVFGPVCDDAWNLAGVISPITEYGKPRILLTLQHLDTIVGSAKDKK